MGSDGNIMPFHLYKNYSLAQQWINWQQQKMQIKLKTYVHTTIKQLGRCKVKIENNKKCKTCIFFVVLADAKALLGMPDIEFLNILNINCNTIGTEKDEKGTNCNANKGSTIDERSV